MEKSIDCLVFMQLILYILRTSKRSQYWTSRAKCGTCYIRSTQKDILFTSESGLLNYYIQNFIERCLFVDPYWTLSLSYIFVHPAGLLVSLYFHKGTFDWTNSKTGSDRCTNRNSYNFRTFLLNYFYLHTYKCQILNSTCTGYGSAVAKQLYTGCYSK